MLKFFTTVLLLLGYLLASAQKISPHWTPHNIDSLKKVVSSAHGINRVNLLNELSYAYYYVQTDSSRSYAQQAYSEASILGYQKGLAISLLYSGQLEHLLNNKKSGQYAGQAFEAAKKSGDKKTLAVASIFLSLHLPHEKAFELLEKANAIFKNIDDVQGQLDVLGTRGYLYSRSGQTYNALQAYNQYAQLGKQEGSQQSKANSFQQLGRIYSKVGDYATANAYQMQSISIREKHNIPSMGGYDEAYYNYLQTKKYDSALYCINQYIATINFYIKDSVLKENRMIPSIIKKGEVYLRLGFSDSALALLLPIMKKNSGSMKLMSLIGEAYNNKKEYTKALSVGRELMQLATAKNIQSEKINASGVLSSAYAGIRQTDSALYYSKLYSVLKEKAETGNFDNYRTFYKTVIENETAKTKIELLDKDNRMKKQQINYLIIAILGISMLGFFVYRLINLKRKNETHLRTLLQNELKIERLESEKEQASLHQNAAELEMQALRAQMNPHFIFNCLNAINHFILNNETETASDYLTKFSRLIRMVLQNSSKKNIPLEEELTTLRLYIELEQLRSKNSFEYSITVDKEIDAEIITIPGLLIQPFVENAIWHGLMQKKEKGFLNVDVVQQNEMLYCTITDNGIGRYNSAANAHLLPGKKSVGLQITANRLKMMNAEGKGKFTIIDLKDINGKPCGTKVIIAIPVVFTEAVSV